MTDKQIIIDGVDVSGCGYYDPNADKESHFLHDCKKEHAPCWSCASMPSCLYKKYKRKEQECEELKKQRQADKGLITSTGKMNYQLLQEYDQLKAENEELKKLLKVRIEDLCDSCGASSMMPMPCKVYEKTLTEIKEIARVGAFYWKHYKEESKRYNEILQKISEVENGN